jgi:hypothetical protein
MLKINCELSLEEADTLADIFNDAICKCTEKLVDAHIDKKPRVATWFKAHKKYLTVLKNKVFNSCEERR